MNTEQIQQLILTDKIHSFYISRSWKRLRKEVLEQDKHECQHCKAKGKYTRGTHIHHINFVLQHPELAMSKTYIDESGAEQRNLITLCFDCHEQIHEYRLIEKKEPLTVERW